MEENVRAIPVEKVEATRAQILATFDEFISEYRHYSQSSIDYFGGKAESMETARRLVNAALVDLCRED